MNTTRTDKQAGYETPFGEWKYDPSGPKVHVGFARDLEIELNDAKAAIKSAYWQLLPFLKPGDEKTKAVLEQLQKFL